MNWKPKADFYRHLAPKLLAGMPGCTEPEAWARFSEAQDTGRSFVMFHAWGFVDD